jgi:hypothetical protein
MISGLACKAIVSFSHTFIGIRSKKPSCLIKNMSKEVNGSLAPI